MNHLKRLVGFLLMMLILSMLTLVFTPESRAEESAIPMYVLENLGELPGDPGGTAWGINDQGDVVGWSGYPPQAFIWREGEGLTALGFIPGYDACIARDINNKGEVAGSCGYEMTGPMPMRATRWLADGTPQNLGSLSSGMFSEAWGINELGNVVGSSSLGGGNPWYHAFFYSDAGGLVDITPGIDGLVSAYAINDTGATGQVVGTMTAASFVWSEGNLEWLASPAGFPWTYAFAVNDLGQIGGSASIANGDLQRVMRWTEQNGWQDLGGYGETNMTWAINNHGVIVGRGRLDIYEDAEHAYIYTAETGLRDLNDFLVTPGWYLYGAHDINDSGQIAAYAMHGATGTLHGVRLTPQGGPTAVTVSVMSSNVPGAPIAAVAGVTVLLLSAAFAVARRR